MNENQPETQSRRHRPGLFWPIALITVGIVFLMDNMGLLSGDAWGTLLRLWPLLLILIGLDGFWRRQGWVGASLMITLGVVFLLNNFGYLALNVWQVIFNLWPILLVAIGFDILIGHRSKIAAFIGLVIVLALLAGALWVMGTDLGGAQLLNSQEIRQDLNGAKQAVVLLEPGAAYLHLEHMREPIALIMGTVPPDDRVQLFQKFTLDGDKANYTLRSTSVSSMYPQNTDVYMWDLTINSDIPVDLQVKLGAGEATLDLERLNLSNLVINMGAGQAEVVLPATVNLDAWIDLAVGQLIIIVPPDIGLRVKQDTAIVSVQTPDGYSASNGIYTSPGYEDADVRIELRVNLVIGQLIIREQ